MLKLLLKKQIAEFFRSFFYDYKNNKVKTKAQIGKSILFYCILMGFLASSFAAIESQVGKAFCTAGIAWMYFLILSAISLLLGVFGSVFNTFSGLYLSKDNDLLISMPIPVKYIVCSRIFGVYLMGLLYSGIITVPTVVIGFVYNSFSLLKLLGGISYIFIISALTLVLSCILGFFVAKLSVKLKNKSYFSTALMLAGIGLYYFGYSRFNEFISQISENAVEYGTSVQLKAYFLYLFGAVGEGNLFAIIIFLLLTLAITGIVLFVLTKTFLKIATATSGQNKVKYVERKYKSKTSFSAVLQKEFARFTSSSTYMVNCGLGVIMVPTLGIVALLNSARISEAITNSFGSSQMLVLLVSGAMCLACCGNDIAAPSISLEGKNIWILQSLPIDVKTVLRAKLTVHLTLSIASSLIGSAILTVAFAKTVVDALFIFIIPLIFNLFLACFDLLCGLKMPMLNWTNEIYPIKQGGAVVFALFGGWIITVIVFGGYFLLMKYVSPLIYLLFVTALLSALAVITYRWLMKKGTEIFNSLK